MTSVSPRRLFLLPSWLPCFHETSGDCGGLHVQGTESVLWVTESEELRPSLSPTTCKEQNSTNNLICELGSVFFPSRGSDETPSLANTLTAAL